MFLLTFLFCFQCRYQAVTDNSILAVLWAAAEREKHLHPGWGTWNVGHCGCYMLGDGDNMVLAWRHCLSLQDHVIPYSPLSCGLMAPVGMQKASILGGQLWNVTCKCYRCTTEDF